MFADQINYYLNIKGWPLYQLAKDIGISPNHLSGIVTCSQKPTKKEFNALKKYSDQNNLSWNIPNSSPSKGELVSMLSRAEDEIARLNKLIEKNKQSAVSALEKALDKIGTSERVDIIHEFKKQLYTKNRPLNSVSTHG